MVIVDMVKMTTLASIVIAIGVGTLAIAGGAISTLAQMTMDNATSGATAGGNMSAGNMTAGNMTAGAGNMTDMTGSISKRHS